MPSDGEKGSSVGSLFSEHLGLVLGFSSIFVVALRLLLVSRGNTSTALAILQIAGPGTVATSAALIVSFIALPYALVLTLLSSHLPPDRRPPVLLRVCASVIMFGLCVAITPPSFTGVALAAYVVSIPLMKRHDNLSWAAVQTGPLMYKLVINVVVFTLMLLLAFAFAVAPWGPRESLTVKGRSRPVVGQVIGRDGRDLMVLKDDQLMRIPSEDIVARQICDKAANPPTDPKWMTGSIWTHLYPSCNP